MTQLPQTRQSLLLQLRSRTSDAWQEFLEIYEVAIYRSCRRRGLQDADANDVTQEVLAAVDRKVATWSEDAQSGSFRGWLFQVARNIAVDRMIERSRRATGSGDTQVADFLQQVPADTGDDEEAFRLEYRRALMSWAADQVRPGVAETSWRSFWSTAIEGRSPREVADELGLSVGAVYTAKCRVFARMRKAMDGLDDDARSLAEHSAETEPKSDPSHA